MIQVSLQTELLTAASEVLESMCFLELATQDTLPSDNETNWITRRLEFHGLYVGSFGLRATLPAATLITSNLLGQEPDQLTEKQIGESMGEIANMVCGSLLGRVETKQAFDLTSPYDDCDLALERIAGNRTTSSFSLEDGIVTMWLEIRH